MLAFEFLGGKTQIGLQVVSSSYSIRNNTTVTLTATATVGSVGYPNATLTFYNSDFAINYGTAVTNASGIATKTITVNNSAGAGFFTPMNFYVGFAGDTTYDPATSNSISIVIQPLTISALTSNNYAVRSGATVLLTTTLSAGGTGYSGATVGFYNSDFSVGSNTYTYYGTATTNTSGVAVKAVVVNNNPTGTGDGFYSPMNFYARFPGDSGYNAISTDFMQIAVTANVAFSSFSNSTAGSTGTWTVPAGVSTISVLAIGAGGSARLNPTKGGGGGATAIYNNYSVYPGQTLSFKVGTTTLNNDGTSDCWVKDASGNYIVYAQGGWDAGDNNWGDSYSANWLAGQFGGRGGQGGEGYLYVAGNPAGYYPHGGGGGAAGGWANNGINTGTGKNVGFNGEPLYVGPGPTAGYTITGANSTNQPSGGSAGIWYSSSPTGTGYGSNGGCWTVNANGVMTIVAPSTATNSTTYGGGAGGPGVAYQDGYPVPAAMVGNKGFIQIMWGNYPQTHTFPLGLAG